MIDTILFDLDGTLCNSVPLIIKASRAAQEKMNIPWDEPRCRRQIGAVIQEIGKEVAGERWEEYLQTYQYFYETFFRSSLTSFPGLPELLRELQQKGFALGVVTSRRRHGTDRALDFLELTPYFGAVITSNDCAYHKPHPAPAQMALAKLEKLPSQTIFVGDTPYDVGCGLAAGCTTVAVAWGAGLPEELVAACPHKIVETVAQLRSYLLAEADEIAQ